MVVLHHVICYVEAEHSGVVVHEAKRLCTVQIRVRVSSNIRLLNFLLHLCSVQDYNQMHIGNDETVHN